MPGQRDRSARAVNGHEASVLPTRGRRRKAVGKQANGSGRGERGAAWPVSGKEDAATQGSNSQGPAAGQTSARPQHEGIGRPLAITGTGDLAKTGWGQRQPEVGLPGSAGGS